MRSRPAYMDADGSEWVTAPDGPEGDGEAAFGGVLHKDSYEPLIDQRGRPIPPPDVPLAPVAP